MSGVDGVSSGRRTEELMYFAIGGRSEPVSAARGAIFAIPGMFLALGLIPPIRWNRALSGDNFAEVKRRSK